MLILDRRIGEVLNIGNDTTIRVLGVKGTKVRLGCEAPDDVSIHREEIFLKIEEERKASSRLKGREVQRKAQYCH